MGNNCCQSEKPSATPKHSVVCPSPSIPNMHPKVHSLIDNVYKGKSQELTSIDFSERKIGEEGGRYLAVVLPYCTQLTQLSLNNCGLRNLSIDSITSALKNLPELQILELSNNPLEIQGSFLVGEAVHSLSKLRKLSLENCRIQIGIEGLSKGLIRCKYLLELNLSQNKLGSEGAKSLSRTLRSLPSLEVLQIVDNNIGTEGARALAQGLKLLDHMKKLMLSTNNIGTDGVLEVWPWLPSTLEEIHLENNLITDEGGKNICYDLLRFSNLKVLMLDRNEFSKKTAKGLIEVLPQLRISLLGLSESGLSEQKKVLSMAAMDCEILF